jgi:hypothetical protein
MNIFTNLYKKIKLRFYSTASLVSAYELLDTAEVRKSEVYMSDPVFKEAKIMIYDELVRRGDESLVGG